MKVKMLCIAILTVFFVLSSPLLRGEETKADALSKTKIDQWLQLGPVAVPAHAATFLKDDDAILEFPHLDISSLRPVAGERVNWWGNQSHTWKPARQFSFDAPQTRILYLAVYLQPQQRLKTKLVVDNPDIAIGAYLDGKGQKAVIKEKRHEVILNLNNTKHLLVLKVLIPKGQTVAFTATLEQKEPFLQARVNQSLSPNHFMKMENVLSATMVGDVKLSPNGRMVVVPLQDVDSRTGKSKRWLELLDTASGQCLFSSRDLGSLSAIRWLNHSRAFTYTYSDDKKTGIVLYDVNTRQRTTLMEGITDFNTYHWSPDNSFLIYGTTETDKAGEVYTHIQDLLRRNGAPASHTSWFIHFPAPGFAGPGITHQIAEGKHEFSNAYISPTNKQVLFLKMVSDYQTPAYVKYSFHLLDLTDQSLKDLCFLHTFKDVVWSPDGSRLLILAGPSAFNGAGRSSKLKNDQIPNDYDNQAYIYHLKNGDVQCLTIDFDPAVDRVVWDQSLNDIYFQVTEKSYQPLYRYNLKSKRFDQLNTGVDIVKKFDLTPQANIAVFWGCGAVSPFKLYAMKLKGNRATVLKDYNRDMFSRVTLGKCINADMDIGGGKNVPGHLYYPVPFDPAKKYPCIVYYYGGTAPVSREFGGRYPKNWYAAKGYFVYVPQPSGTTGFGQEYSARHVNDWGKTTSDEVIAAVKKLTSVNKNIDPKRIGAMGASYGGFLTQYLATKTDIFAAYISHAGISSLASYWGVGDYGYLYSGIATAQSFPWNRKDIYVGHSPLYMADRIQNPILLLHGDIDNNVPPGESHQMYTALKLLGKEVELVTFKDQYHFIAAYKQRVQWMKTIIAWWDKHLKGEPQYWDALYTDEKK